MSVKVLLGYVASSVSTPPTFEYGKMVEVVLEALPQRMDQFVYKSAEGTFEGNVQIITHELIDLNKHVIKVFVSGIKR